MYETLPGWSEDITDGAEADRPARRRPGDTSTASRELVGLQVSVVSVGPDREQTIRL